MADISSLLQAVAKSKKEPSILDYLTKITQETEGLFPGQTPIRITNDSMRNWKTIQGIPIEYPENTPKDRKNFFWVSPGMEKEVIKRQWRSYFKNPKRFGLNENSTIEDIIKIFDQTNPKNKLKALKDLGIDPKSKMNKFDVSQLQPDNSNIMNLLNQILTMRG